MTFKNWLFNVVLFPLSKEEVDLLKRINNSEIKDVKDLMPEDIPAINKLIKRGFIKVLTVRKENQE